MELGTAQNTPPANGFRQVMADQGRQWQWLAAKLGVHPSTLLRWSNGDAKPSYLCHVEQIAAILEVHVDQLT